MPVRELKPDEEVVRTTRETVRELEPDETVIRSLTPQEQFGRGANIGIAETLGAPVDLANFVLGFIGLESEEPVLGSQQIRRGFAALGLAPPPGQDDPESLFGSVGKVTGAATSMLLPLGPGVKGAREMAMGIRQAPSSIPGRMYQDIGRTALEAPGRFLAMETAGAAGAGTAGYWARQRFPDSEAAAFTAEVLGGMGPGAVVGMAKLVPTVLGVRLARYLARPFTRTGGLHRAEHRMQEVARKPETAIEQLAGSEALPEARLTPAQRTGDEGLLSLERSVIDSSEQLKGEAEDQIAQATRAIRESLAGLGEDIPPEKTAETLEEARAYVQSLLDTRVRIAAQRADERIAELGPQATRQDANLIAREELQNALRAARQQEREYWDLVPDEIFLSTARSKEAFQQVVETTSRARQRDIPDIARQFLDPDSNQAFTDMETVRELHGLRSALLEDARKARAANEFNKARIADDLADAILADLGAQRDNIEGQVGDALRTALDFSADLNDRFTRGPVGRILGSERKGGVRMPEALTLEATIGRAGPRARTETQAILEATESPALRNAVEDFLLDDFQRRAVSRGRINPKAAETFLARHQDALEEFPELRRRLEGAIEADRFAVAATDRAEGLARRLADPKISRAAIFLKDPLEGAMARIAKSQKPAEAMTEIVRQAGRDPTGDAVKGLKTAFGDYLLQQSAMGRATVEGEFVVSGQALRRILKEGPTADMAKTLLSPAEQKRLQEMVDVAIKIEKAIAARARPEGIIADRPAMFSSMIARIVGAQLGREVAVRTGGGTVQTPGILSNLFNRLIANHVRDPGRYLLINAMQDEKLFSALLNPGKTAAQQKVIRRQLNAWLVSVGMDALREDMEE